MDVDQMPAGVELDVLVAEALGYVQATSMATGAESTVFIVVEGVPSVSDDKVYIRQGADDFTYFAPSTDIAAAWEIVQALTQQGYTLRLVGPEVPDTTGYLIEKRWSAAFMEPQYAFTNVEQDQGRGSTPSLAICRAALKVMKGAGEVNEH